jgi:hypothetical protein
MCHQYSVEPMLGRLAWVGAPRLVASQPPDTRDRKTIINVLNIYVLMYTRHTNTSMVVSIYNTWLCV